MSKAIQVVVTTTYQYVPDYNDWFYKENNINTIEDALEFDKGDLAAGDLAIDEVAGPPHSTITSWSIVDE